MRSQGQIRQIQIWDMLSFWAILGPKILKIPQDLLSQWNRIGEAWAILKNNYDETNLAALLTELEAGRMSLRSRKTRQISTEKPKEDQPLVFSIFSYVLVSLSIS